MNAFLILLGEVPVLCGAVSLALGAAAISLCGLLLARLVQRQVVLQQALLTTALLTILSLPLLFFLDGRIGLIRPERPSVALTQNAQRQQTTLARSAPVPPRREAPSSSGASGAARISPASLPLGLVVLWGWLALWGIGALGNAGKVLLDLRVLQRVRTTTIAAPPEWQERVRLASVQVGLSCVPKAVFTGLELVPFTQGGRRPLIVLPRSLEELDALEAEALLLHECAHLAHRHLELGVLMTIASTLYWWIPSVAWMNRVLSETLESICDNHVIRAQGSGRALGHCLVRAAEAATKRSPMLPGSAILTEDRSLSRRLMRILEVGMNRETTLSWSGRLITASAAATWLAVGAFLRVAPAAAEETKQDWEAYFPTVSGSEWVYRATYAGQEKNSEHVLRARRQIPLKKGGACAEIETLYDGRKGGFLYVGHRPEGYYSYANDFIGMPGVDEATPPLPLARIPLKVGQAWTWEEPWRGQTEGNGKPTDTRTWGSHCRATVETMGDQVSVPAGQYRAMRIQIQRKNTQFGDSTEFVWYAKGVGVVRREGRTPGKAVPDSLVELTRFTPGNPNAESEQDILPRVRAALPPEQRSVRLREVPLEGGAFRSRFVVAEGPSQSRTLYRVMAKKVSRFTPQQTADWNRLLAEERAPAPTFGGSAANQAFAQDMGRLIGEGLGLPVDSRTATNTITTRENKAGGLELSFTVSGGGRQTPSWSVLVELLLTKQGEILRLQAKVTKAP